MSARRILELKLKCTREPRSLYCYWIEKAAISVNSEVIASVIVGTRLSANHIRVVSCFSTTIRIRNSQWGFVTPPSSTAVRHPGKYRSCLLKDYNQYSCQLNSALFNFFRLCNFLKRRLVKVLWLTKASNWTVGRTSTSRLSTLPIDSFRLEPNSSEMQLNASFSWKFYSNM